MSEQFDKLGMTQSMLDTLREGFERLRPDAQPTPEGTAHTAAQNVHAARVLLGEATQSYNQAHVGLHEFLAQLSPEEREAALEDPFVSQTLDYINGKGPRPTN